MNARPWVLASGLLALVGASVARAESMDPALERLVENPECRDPVGRATGGPLCQPDHAAFKQLISEYGFAFAPTAMHPARTTGYGGLSISLQGAYTSISSGKSYWQLGTEGTRDALSARAPVRNEDPASLLQLYSIRLRKGLGFGLELAGSVGFMPNTRLVGGGADLRLALLEGFRTGVLGIFPDLAAGAGVRTITGTSQFQLTVAALDAQISKPLPVRSTGVVTPWIGYQHLWIFGDSGDIDLTPATSAQGTCGYAGINVPGNPDPNKDDYDGLPVCRSPGPFGSRDFRNTTVFNRARLERHRLLVGLQYRYEMLAAGAELITDLVRPARAQSSPGDEEVLEDEKRQWTLVLELGLAF